MALAIVTCKDEGSVSAMSAAPDNACHIGQDLHIGQELRGAREQAGLSLQDISVNLHISAAYLGAIERLDTQALPSLGYVLGFMRSYAKFLGLDVTDAVARYKLDSEIPQDLGMRDAPHFVARRRVRLPKGSIAAGTIISLFGVFTAWYSMTSTAQTAAPVNTLLEVTTNMGLATPAPTTGDPNVISLVAVSASWVEVLDANGDVMTSRIFVPGEIFETRTGANVSVSVRDGGAFELYRGGENTGLLGERGVSIKTLLLDQ
jgi:cytoskeletal protein RodZ